MSVVKGPVPSPMCMLFAVCLAACLTTAIISWHCWKWFHAKPLESPWSWMAIAEWLHAKPVESKPYVKPWMVASVTANTCRRNYGNISVRFKKSKRSCLLRWHIKTFSESWVSPESVLSPEKAWKSNIVSLMKLEKKMYLYKSKL